MSFEVHGIGSKLYGQGDCWPDGSFVTTEWFVLGYVPVIPICSKRISYRRETPYAQFDARESCYVYETLAVNRKQATYTYLWLIGAIGQIVIYANFQDTLSKIIGDADWAAGACLGLMGAALMCPFLLRRYVKRRNAEKWRREALGLHG